MHVLDTVALWVAALEQVEVRSLAIIAYGQAGVVADVLQADGDVASICMLHDVAQCLSGNLGKVGNLFAF